MSVSCREVTRHSALVLFQEIVSHHALAVATGKQGSLDATDWALRKEDSAQQGVSSLPHGKIKMGRHGETKQTMEIGKSSRATQKHGWRGRGDASLRNSSQNLERAVVHDPHLQDFAKEFRAPPPPHISHSQIER